MSLISTILTLLSALLFFYIFYLETLTTTSSKTSQVFGLSQEVLKSKEFNVLMRNQGVYNAFIGFGLLYGTFFASHPKEVVGIFLVNIVVVAAYGAATSDKSILLKQGGLPILTLISLLF